MRTILIAVAFCSLGTGLLAQKSPKNSSQVLVGVHLQVSANNAAQACSYRLTYTTNETTPINNPLWDAWINVPQDPTAAPVQSPNVVEAVTPGRIYYVIFGSAAVNYADFQFNVPPGYTVFVAPPATGAFVPSTTMSSPNYQGCIGNFILPFYVLPSDGAAWLAAGYSTAPQVSDVTWAISLGTLSNGSSAGALRWESPTVAQSLLDSSSLNYSSQAAGVSATSSNYTGTISGSGWYSALSIPDEMATYYDNSGRLRYIGSNQIQIYITQTGNAGYSNGGTSGSYTIQVYPAGTPFQWVNGDPNQGWVFASGYSTQYTIADPNYQGSSYPWSGNVQIAKLDVASGNTQTWTLQYNASTGTTTLTQANGSLRTIKWQSVSNSGTRTELETVSGPNGTAYQTLRTYQTFPWYEELVSEVVDPVTIPSGFTGVNGDPAGLALTTNYTYYNTTAGDGHYSKLQSVTKPDGSWILYNYSDAFATWGQLVSVSTPWQDAPTTYSAATASNCKVDTYSYTNQVYNGYLIAPSTTPRTSVFQSLNGGSSTSINGTVTDETVITPSLSLSPSYSTYLFNNEPMRTDTINSYYSAGSYQSTTRTVFHDTADPIYRGKLYSQVNPDGTKVSASYWRGDFISWIYIGSSYNASYVTPDSNSPQWIETYFTGTSTQQDPSAVLFTTDGYTNGRAIDPVWMTPYRSYRKQTVRDIYGNPQYSLTYVFTGGTSFQLISWKITNYTWDGLLYSSSDSTGNPAIYYYNQGVCWESSGADGTVTQKTLDALLRPTISAKVGASSSGSYAAQPYINTAYSYDAADNVLGTTVSSPSGPSLSTSAVYNQASLVTSTVDEKGLTTGYAYLNGGSTVTVTNPNGSTVTSTKHLDGSPNAMTGNGQVNQFTSSVVNSDGTITTTTYLGSAGSARWSSTQTDWLGRKIAESHPEFLSGTFTKQYYYNSLGQLYKMTQPGMAATLYEYDGLGELQYSGLAIEGGSTLDLNGIAGGPSDRVSETRTKVVNQNGAWWKETVTSVFNKDGNSTPVTSSTVLTKLVPWDFNVADTNSETDTIDYYGNTTVETTVQNSTSRLVTHSIVHPDSSAPEVRISYNGLLMSSQTAQNILTTYQYDGIGRETSEIDPRKGTSYTAYYTSGAGQTGRIQTATDAAGNPTNFAYDATDGRLLSQTDAQGNTIYHGYDHVGREIKRWGTGTYPVEYAFDVYGKQEAMRTFRSTSINFGGTSWPLSDDGSDPQSPNPSSWTSGDATTWTFDAGSGLLSQKKDAAGQSVSFTYWPDGKINTRTWARGVVTTHTYDANSAQLTGVSYSDGVTPSLTYSYDRLGHKSSVAEAIPGGATITTALQYNVPGKLTQQNFDATYFAGRQLVYQLDAANAGTLGRTEGYTLGTSGSPTSEQSVTYNYDSMGRLNYVGYSGLPAFTYGFTANSNLVGSITDAADNWTQARTWDTHRDLLGEVKTSVGSTVEGDLSYQFDSLGRRSSKLEEGALFARYPAAGLVEAFSYDSKGEVTGDQVYHSTNPTSPTIPVMGRDFAYQYDPIGNRTTSAIDSTFTTTYTSNALNQIATRAVPGNVAVSGLAPLGASVTLNGTAIPTGDFDGQYYLENVSVSNSSAPQWLTASLSSSLGGSVTASAFVPQTPETFVYDADGNLLSDGRWNYGWDGENHLAWMETYGNQSGNSTAVWNSGVTRIHIQFTYDFLGRRIAKVDSSWNGSAWVATTATRYIYSGWNLIADYNYNVSSGAITPTDTYLWGLDLSGNLHKAGGVGGLLVWINLVTGAAEMPIYDGNGNVQGLTDRGTGQITAAYEYSPYGELLRATGVNAQANPFQFSTKYTDLETSLVYYGRRYYIPSLGRFFERDSIEEKGGLNLYGFVNNNAINGYDVGGMTPQSFYNQFNGIQYLPVWQQQGIMTLARTYSQSPYGSGTLGGYNNYEADQAGAEQAESEAQSAQIMAINKALGPTSGTINPIGTVVKTVTNALQTVSEGVSTGPSSQSVSNGTVTFGTLQVVNYIENDPDQELTNNSNDSANNTSLGVLPENLSQAQIQKMASEEGSYYNSGAPVDYLGAVGSYMQKSGMGNTLQAGAAAGETGAYVGPALALVPGVATGVIVAATSGSWQAQVAFTVVRTLSGNVAGVTAEEASGSFLADELPSEIVIDGTETVTGPVATPPPPSIPVATGPPVP